MAKFLQHIVLLLLIMAVLYPLLLWQGEKAHLSANVAYTRGNYSHLLRRGQDVRHYDSVDVLFIGSSRCYRSFDTRYYAEQGITTFNLGSSNQTPVQTLALLRGYLDSLHPRCVVMEVNPDVMGDDGVEGGMDLVSNLPVSLPIAAMMLCNGDPYSLNMLALAMEKHWKNKDFGDSDSLIPVNPEGTLFFAYIPGGFVESSPHHWTPTPQPATDVRMLDKQLKAVSQCQRLCRKKGIPLLLTEVPCSNAKYTCYGNHDVFAKAMRNINADYVDCNAMEIFDNMEDSIHFYDVDHLNREGVAFFSPHFLYHVLLPFLKHTTRRTRPANLTITTS